VDSEEPSAVRTARYPSDVTDEEWNVVQPYVVPEGSKCSPTPERMREILNGVLYVLSTGCQWPRCRRICRRAAHCMAG
jgi:transposase